MKKVLYAVCMAAFVTVLSSCELQVADLVDAEEERLGGKYEVTNYRVSTYNSIGQEISIVNNENYGTIELIMNSDEGSDVFSHFIFKGPVSASYIPKQINTSEYCGYQVKEEQLFSVFYECDPSKKRLLIAAICPMETLSYFVDYSYNGSELQFYTRVINRFTGNQEFYEYLLKRL
jgi:hypothetical protein